MAFAARQAHKLSWPLILMASPVAGLRPMRALRVRLFTARRPIPGITNFSSGLRLFFTARLNSSSKKETHLLLFDTGLSLGADLLSHVCNDLRLAHRVLPSSCLFLPRILCAVWPRRPQDARGWDYSRTPPRTQAKKNAKKPGKYGRFLATITLLEFF